MGLHSRGVVVVRLVDDGGVSLQVDDVLWEGDVGQADADHVCEAPGNVRCGEVRFRLEKEWVLTAHHDVCLMGCVFVIDFSSIMIKRRKKTFFGQTAVLSI